MKNYEALELQAKAMRLVEGTDLFWYACVRNGVTKRAVDHNWEAQNPELAFAIVEGKPVFKGDELWNVPNRFKFTADYYEGGLLGSRKCNSEGQSVAWLTDCSWNPPKPRTVMVELLVEDVEKLCGIFDSANIGRACRKALGELK